eukprot:1177038-Prorocentrum_minimum.AAC.1
METPCSANSHFPAATLSAAIAGNRRSFGKPCVPLLRTVRHLDSRSVVGVEALWACLRSTTLPLPSANSPLPAVHSPLTSANSPLPA